MKVESPDQTTEESSLAEFNHVNFKCPHCNSKAESILLKEASFLTYFLSILTLLIFGLFSIILLPLIIQSSKTIVRRCADCSEVIEQHDLFAIPSLSDEILNFRCGNCAIVISRKYLLILFGFLAGLWVYNNFINPSPPKYRLLQQLTWQEYADDCGRNVFLNNEVRAKKNFEEKYKFNWVKWEGVFIKIDAKVDAFSNNLEHRHLHIKMNPTDSALDYPDITFRIDNSFYNANKDVFDILIVGDVIKFVGKFSHIGDEFSFHYMYLLEIEKTEEKVELSSIEMIKSESKIGGNLRKDSKNKEKKDSN